MYKDGNGKEKFSFLKTQNAVAALSQDSTSGTLKFIIY
jgi:hypothetical protein